MEGTLSIITKTPLIKPITIPIKTDIRIAAGRGIPWVTNIAVIVPAKAMVEPMERSKLPDIISRVTAHPAITTETI